MEHTEPEPAPQSEKAEPAKKAPVAAKPAAPSAAPGAAPSVAQKPDAPAVKEPVPAQVEDASERLSLQGNAIQGGLIFAKIDGKAKSVRFPGHKVVIADDGRFLIGFSRTAPPKQKLSIQFEDGSKVEHDFEVGQRTFTPEEVEIADEDDAEVEGDERKPKAEADARIQAARMRYSKEACYGEGFQWPAKGKITSRYGFPRILNGKERGVHWGVDIAVPKGTPVKAPACGTIVFAQENIPLSGTTIIIDHGHGLTSALLHLSKIDKKVGDTVKKGEVVARSGDSGRVTGPHLDWRMNVFDVRIDPELLFPPSRT